MEQEIMTIVVVRRVVQEYSELRNKVLYPDIVKQRRKINVSFGDLKSMQNTNH